MVSNQTTQFFERTVVRNWLFLWISLTTLPWSVGTYTWVSSQGHAPEIQGCCVFKIIGLQTHASFLRSASHARKKTQKTQNFLKQFFSNANQRKIRFWPDFVSCCGSNHTSFVKSNRSCSKWLTNPIKSQKSCWNSPVFTSAFTEYRSIWKKWTLN